MENGVDLVVPDYLLHKCRIRDVSLYERSPLSRPDMASAEVVQSNRNKSRLEQGFRCVTADVSRSTGQQYVCHL